MIRNRIEMFDEFAQLLNDWNTREIARTVNAAIINQYDDSKDK